MKLVFLNVTSMGMNKLILVVFLALGSISYADSESVPCIKAGAPECSGILKTDSARMLKYVSTFDLNTPHPEISNAIFTIHASDRVIDWGYNMLNGLAAKRAIPADTLILGPVFYADVDKPAAGFLYWGTNDWSAGLDSLDGSKTSSFAALDLLVRKVLASGHFPNIKTVTVTGLSAGGQATQRYSLGTNVDHEFPNVKFRFIIVAPSSYTYISPVRVVPGTQDQFAVPSNPGCAYNDYRYGTDHLSSYMSRMPLQTLTTNFIARELAIVSGELDNATVHPNPPIQNDNKDGAGLDTSCQAELQGRSRLERSYIFAQYLTTQFPQNKHIWFSVPGVAHEYQVYEDARTLDFLNFR